MLLLFITVPMGSTEVKLDQFCQKSNIKSAARFLPATVACSEAMLCFCKAPTDHPDLNRRVYFNWNSIELFSLLLSVFISLLLFLFMTSVFGVWISSSHLVKHFAMFIVYGCGIIKQISDSASEISDPYLRPGLENMYSLFCRSVLLAHSSSRIYYRI